ncbi:heparinase II/III family protein [Qipengyuania sp. JC766]|uniref:heparinase II/III family protein n=1 Tax=Qipengyuania sp. JC766 TaxID=3232139 RepID=UPI00345A1AB9
MASAAEKTRVEELSRPAQTAFPLDDDRVEPTAITREDVDGTPAETTGRALAIADIPQPGTSLTERFIRTAYRLGVPANLLSSPFGVVSPLRLLATAESPLPGNRAAGVALRAGHFLVDGAKLPISGVDMEPSATMVARQARAIHGFGWVRDLSTAVSWREGAPIAERILDAWLASNAEPARNRAWSVELTAMRLMAWLTDAPLVLSAKDGRRRKQLFEHMAITARWLDRKVPGESDKVAQVLGWAAIVAAGLMLPDGKPRRIFGEAGLVRAFGEAVAEDGGVLSRCPLSQRDIIAALIDLRACYAARRIDPPEAIETMLALTVPPLLALVHSDGGLGSWQGGSATAAYRIAALVEASGVRARPLSNGKSWGYHRVALRDTTLQFDAAPPPLGRHARSGCASTLAFEFCPAGHRLIVNCGGAALAGGLVPARIEQGLRASAAHSTLTLDDANSTAVLGRGGLGNGVNAVEVDRRVVQDKRGKATIVTASHDGYAARYGLLHERTLALREDGMELQGEDQLVPSGKRGKRGKIALTLRFHLGKGVQARLTEDARGAGLALPDGSFWQFRLGAEASDVSLALEESLWVDGEGRPCPIEQLVVHGMISRSGGRFPWLFKKMG